MKTKKAFSIDSEREAWMAVALCFTIFKDEHTETLTTDIFVRTFHMCNVYGRGQFMDVFNNLMKIAYTFDYVEIIESSLKYVHPEDYKTLFIYCVDILGTIGNIDSDKLQRLEYLREVFSISIEEANDICEFVRIKNKKDIKWSIDH